MDEAIDREVVNLSTCKLRDILRLSEIVKAELGFLAEVRREIERRDCVG